MKNESKNRLVDDHPGTAKLKLGDIIDAAELQAIADEFFKITNVGIGIIDMEGNIFVANGWQDICTKFHRVNPITCKNCIESDIVLSKVNNSESSGFKAYKCKNHLWDISTPLIIEGKQYGNIFLGQFFYDDETPDYDLFRLQAKEYGFDEKAYLDALDRVPRWSKAKVESVIGFYSRMAGFISRISISKLKISETLEQKNEAEEALKNNYSLLRIAGKTACFGGWQLNLATNTVTWSDEVAKIHEMPAGYSPKLSEGINFYAPEWRDKIAALVNDCAEKGIPYDNELEIITAKGNRIWVRTTGEPVRNNKGKIIGLQGAFQDISEQKREAELLRQSEEQFRLLYENMAEGVFFQLADGKLIDINPAGLKMFGISKEQFLGRTFYHPDWKVVDEDGDLLVPEQYPSVLATNSGKEIEKTVGVFNPANQCFNWLIVNAKPQFTADSDQLSHVFVTMHDITDRKLKELVNNSRLHLSQFAQSHSLDELLEETLNEAEKLTNSKIGFFHFVEENQEQLHLQNWSLRTKREFCKAEGKGAHYNISEAGVWVDCFYKKQPVVHNNYASLPNRKGMPAGHAEVIRELVVPIIRGEKVVAILGIGNKPTDYDERDVDSVSTLANLAWEITGMKRVEEALKKSEKKYRRLAENLWDVIWTTDIEFNTLYISRSCERMYGFTFEQYIKLTVEEKFTADSIKQIKQVFAEEISKENDPAIPKDRSRHMELQHYKADGSTLWIGMNISFTRDKKGLITGFQGVSRDISERKQAEFARQKSEEQANALIQAIPDLIFRLDNLGVYLSFKAASDELCYQTEDLIGKRMRDITPPAFANVVEEKIKVTLETGTTQDFEYEMDIPDRGIQFYEARMAPSGKNEVIAVVRNVTNRKKAEIQIAKSEKEFRSLFDNAPIGIYRTTPDGKILMANPFLLKMLEYNSFEELQLRNLQKEGYEPQYQREKFMQILENEGEVSGLESSWITRNGKTLQMSESARIIRDEKGNVLYYEGMVEDITKQKLHEEDLNHERNILRILIDNLPDAIYFLDSEGRKVISNNADINNIGLSNEADALGKNDLELFPGEIGVRGHADNLSVLQTGIPIINRGENFFDKNGVQTWLETSKFPLYDINRKISGLVGIGHDITKSKMAEMALRESEERYREFINSTQDMAFVKDEKLRYVLVNQSFIRFFERDESEIIGKTDADIMRPEFARNCELSDQEALSSDSLSLSEETVDNVVFEVHKFKVTLNTGKTGIGGYIRNITERKVAEKLVLEQSEKLKELNATKDKFFSIIAHDLRNPFNSIIGFSSILKEEARGLDVSEIIHYASVINNAAGNTMILLDNLLDWALMQQKRIEYAPKLLVVSELVRETIDSVANNAEQKNIQLMSEIPIRLLITADENMIKTVIRNLVSNAIKFTKPGGKVTLSAVELNGEIQISVTDNGIGISSENLSNLFKITSGLSTRGTSNEKGTGLGLILCKEFIEKHGGRIWVNSTLGEGSTFTFSLPE